MNYIPNINYNEFLKNCRNDRGNYAVDIEKHKRQQTILKLLTKLNEAEEVIKTGNEWQTLSDLKSSVGV